MSKAAAHRFAEVCIKPILGLRLGFVAVVVGLLCKEFLILQGAFTCNVGK